MFNCKHILPVVLTEKEACKNTEISKSVIETKDCKVLLGITYKKFAKSVVGYVGELAS